MKKLLIIDGSGLLFQSFYGMPNRIKNYKGQYVEAVVCFTGILLKTIKMTTPTQVFVVFDGENNLSRREIDDEYKANRVDFSQVDDADNPYTQLDSIKYVLNNLNIKWIETCNCEADDLIASIVNDYKDNMEIVISSSDKDFYQLIDDSVSVFTYRGKISKLWDKNSIIDKYGFEPKYFATLKALSGDKSDNISGAKGIGAITAAKLIADFGNIDNIYNNIDKINERVRIILQQNKDKVYKNYSIVQLFTKCGLYELGECDYKMPNKSSTELLKQLGIL